MSIGIIASTRQTLAEPFAGGMEAHTAQLAHALMARGHRVTVHAGPDPHAVVPVDPILDADRALALSDTARNDPSMCPEEFLVEHHAYLALMLNIDERGYDVVHNNSLHYLPLSLAGATATPVVTTLHTPPTPWLESAVKAAPGSTGHLVTVSRSNASHWEVFAGEVEVIHNGIDLEMWEFSETGREGLACWHGRIVPEKGTHLAIDAARLAGMELNFAGPIGDAEYFRSEIEPRLGEDVRHVGHLRAAALAQMIGDAEVAIQTPCWDEPFGLAVAESLACGTPVAGFARGALPEIVTPEVGALTRDSDAAALAAAIAAARACARFECRGRVATAFSTGGMIDRYESLYRSLAHRRTQDAR